MFGKPGIDDVYRHQWPKLQDRIMSSSDAEISGSSTDELIEHFKSSGSFDRIEKDPNREMSVRPIKEVRRVPAHVRDSFHRDGGDTTFEYETIIVSIPLVRNSNINALVELRTSTFSMSWSPKHWDIKPDGITLRIDIKGYGFDYSEDENKVTQMVQSEIANVDQWIGWVNNDIDKENAQLDANLRQFIEQRKSKLQTDKGKIESLVKKLNIPLMKTVDPAAQKIKLDPRPLVKKIKPSPQAQENYVLDHDKVMAVLGIIENQGRQFERTPASYKSSGEEDLRNVILVGLNTVFEGSATGETFSNTGKTDIHLNIDKGNILVFECKIWGGPKLYQEAIDQLLGYLTWRDNFGVIITFVRQKNLTKILEVIPETIKSHPTFKTGVSSKTATHFVSHHVLPQDDGKEVEMHHLFYNLYSGD
jgi:hypothetical protein